MSGREERLKAPKRRAMCPTKKYPGVRHAETQNVPRPLMFSKLKQEVKEDYFKNGLLQNEPVTKQLEPRRYRRIRLLDLVRRTMRMMREQGSHKAA